MTSLNQYQSTFCCLKLHYSEILQSLTRKTHHSHIELRGLELTISCALTLIDQVIINLKTNGISNVTIQSIELFFEYIIKNQSTFALYDKDGSLVEKTGKEIVNFGIYLKVCGKSNKSAYLKTVSPITIPKISTSFSDLQNLISDFNDNGTDDVVIFITNSFKFTEELIINNTTGKNLTIASGTEEKVTFDADGLNRHFNITGSGSGSTTLVGLKLINGKVIDGNGGSISNDGIKLVVNDCIFENNEATESTTRGDLMQFNKRSLSDNTIGNGGGTYLINSANSEVVGTTFGDNKAINGGAIYFCMSHDSEVKNTFFTMNTAMNGGGIYSSISNKLKVNLSGFKLNSANVGGGINFDMSDEFVVNSSLFESNTADSNGGGIRFEKSKNSRVKSSTFKSNSALLAGGGIYLKLSDNLEIDSSIFTMNRYGQAGGGGIFFEQSNNSRVISSIFTKNFGMGGNGMVLNKSTGIKVSNSTLNDGESLYLRARSKSIV